MVQPVERRPQHTNRIFGSCKAAIPRARSVGNMRCDIRHRDAKDYTKCSPDYEALRQHAPLLSCHTLQGFQRARALRASESSTPCRRKMAEIRTKTSTKTGAFLTRRSPGNKSFLTCVRRGRQKKTRHAGLLTKHNNKPVSIHPAPPPQLALLLRRNGRRPDCSASRCARATPPALANYCG